MSENTEAKTKSRYKFYSFIFVLILINLFVYGVFPPARFDFISKHEAVDSTQSSRLLEQQLQINQELLDLQKIQAKQISLLLSAQMPASKIDLKTVLATKPRMQQEARVKIKKLIKIDKLQVSSQKEVRSSKDKAIEKDLVLNKNSANTLEDKTLAAEEDKTLAEKISVCEKYYKAKQMLFGHKGNAFNCYSQLKKQFPNNREVLNGLDNIAKHYVVVIQSALKKNNLKKAKTFLSRLKRIKLKHPDIPLLKQQIKLQKSATLTQKTPQQKTEKIQLKLESNPKSKLKQELQSSLDMVNIPAGCNLLGEQNKQAKVCIKNDFLMAKTEVTQALWQEIMGDNPARHKSCGKDCPVELVSWFDVQKFIRQLNKIRSEKYRLPTETEWEYAARAGSLFAYSYGDDDKQLYRHANYCDSECSNEWRDSSQNDKYSTTAPVAKYKKNAWGLYDMHGNVWEWVQDQQAADDNEQDQTPQHIYRGCSWGDRKIVCYASSRGTASADLKVSALGFRLVKDL